MTDMPERQVSSSTDDGYSYGTSWPGSGTNTYTGNQTRLGANLTTFYSAGFRFQNVIIPQGATITSATLSVKCQTAGNFACDLTIWNHLSDNSATFGTTTDTETGAPPYRSRGLQSAHWNILDSESWVLDSWYTSVDFANVVQEVTNRAGWVSGNALTILLFRSVVTLPSGDARRYIYQYDYTGNVSGPKLNVTYLVPGGVGLFHAHFQGQGII